MMFGEGSISEKNHRESALRVAAGVFEKVRFASLTDCRGPAERSVEEYL